MKRSLHIGLNAVNPASYGGWPGHLNGPTFDVALLAPEIARAGFNTGVLLNESATLANVSNAIRALADDAHNGDVIFLQYSGHGGRQDHGIFGGYHETLCLHDGELLDVELRKLFSHFRAGVKVFALLDSCHSGGLDRAGFTQPRFRPHWVKARAPMLEKGDAPILAEVVLATACEPQETCVEVWMPTHKRVAGAFTQCAHAAFGPDETFGTWHEKLSARALEQFPAQHPRLLKLGPNPTATLDHSIA